jgi:hypothetical protein
MIAPSRVLFCLWTRLNLEADSTFHPGVGAKDGKETVL